MKEIIIYEYETKDKQEAFWRRCESIARVSYADTVNVLKENPKDKSSFHYNIRIYEMSIKEYVMFDMLDEAKDLAKMGIEYLHMHEDKLAGHRYDLYKFDWVLNGKDNPNIIRPKFIDMDRFIISNKPNKVFCIYSELYSLICNDVERAKKFIRLIYEVKPRSRLNTDVIYHLERFYAFIAEYLCAPKKNAEMLPKLTECFKFLFDESQKGSWKLYDRNKIDLTQRQHIFGLRYIWYKYFSGRDWDTVTFKEIVQSERYGIKGLQDC